MFKRAWDSFIGRPVYLHGPPVAAHTRAVTWNLRPAFGTRARASLMAGLALSVSLTSRRSIKSSTRVAMLYTPPIRSYKGFVADWAAVGTAITDAIRNEGPSVKGD